MKSLNDNYAAGAGNSHETFSDLMFCALIVLVLFIMALAIEVSTRVKASMPDKVVEVKKVEEVELSTMTKEEVAELSEKLQKQQIEMDNLKDQLAESATAIQTERDQVQNRMAALSGEQRFTGAREPAQIKIAYDYEAGKFLFISSRKYEHATRRLSGESASARVRRIRRLLTSLAIEALSQRMYTEEEVNAIYEGFSTYKEVEPTGSSYKIVDSIVGISYSTTLCSYIAGDAGESSELLDVVDDLVEKVIQKNFNKTGPKSEAMYPRVVLHLDTSRKKITINGVELSPRDTKEILLSLEGRGAMIDLEGLSGPPPEWLTEEVLIPAGYISKTPKLPSN